MHVVCCISIAPKSTPCFACFFKFKFYFILKFKINYYYYYFEFVVVVIIIIIFIDLPSSSSFFRIHHCSKLKCSSKGVQCIHCESQTPTCCTRRKRKKKTRTKQGIVASSLMGMYVLCTPLASYGGGLDIGYCLLSYQTSWIHLACCFLCIRVFFILLVCPTKWKSLTTKRNGNFGFGLQRRRCTSQGDCMVGQLWRDSPFAWWGQLCWV